MGWLIITLCLTAIFTVISIIGNKNHKDGIEMLGFVGSTILGGISLGLVAVLIASPAGFKKMVAEYKQLQKTEIVTVVPSEALMEKVLDMNNTIISHKVKVNRFLTKGLYSKDIAALELLPVPEPFMDVEIEYD